MPTSMGLITVHAYLAAESYVQGSSAVLAAPQPTAASVQTNCYETAAPPVFFGHDTVAAHPSTPYRSLFLINFQQNILPQGIVDYLLNQALLTGRYYSLFRHGPASKPERYEVRQGSPSGCDRSLLGGETFDALEEFFFETAWVAHVHPPGQAPLPTLGDLAALAERAKLAGGRIVRHSLFGFDRGEPICIELQAFFDPLFREVSILHRAPERLAEATDRRIADFTSSYR